MPGICDTKAVYFGQGNKYNEFGPGFPRLGPNSPGRIWMILQPTSLNAVASPHLKKAAYWINEDITDAHRQVSDLTRRLAHDPYAPELYAAVTSIGLRVALSYHASRVIMNELGLDDTPAD